MNLRDSVIIVTGSATGLGAAIVKQVAAKGAPSPEALEYCLKVYGADKLLYGTDHPFAHFEVFNEMVDNLACSDAERELINHGNAEKLLGL